MTITPHKGSVYLSGPIAGLDYHTARYGWRQQFAEGMAPGITVLSPMRHEGHLAEVRGALEPAGQLDHFFSGSRIIVEKDYLDIQRCDIMVVNLLEAKKVSIGTVAEIGYASALGKKIILVMEDRNSVDNRQYEEDPLSSNIHEHPFVTVPAALRLNNLDDAIYAVNALLSEGI